MTDHGSDLSEILDETLAALAERRAAGGAETWLSTFNDYRDLVLAAGAAAALEREETVLRCLGDMSMAAASMFRAYRAAASGRPGDRGPDPTVASPGALRDMLYGFAATGQWQEAREAAAVAVEAGALSALDETGHEAVAATLTALLLGALDPRAPDTDSVRPHRLENAEVPATWRAEAACLLALRARQA
ncbi:MAG: hypothetical protein AAGF76_15510, partial [Pseudomonadota bacterium]